MSERELPVVVITPEQLAEIAALKRGEHPGQMIVHADGSVRPVVESAERHSAGRRNR